MINLHHPYLGPASHWPRPLYVLSVPLYRYTFLSLPSIVKCANLMMPIKTLLKIFMPEINKNDINIKMRLDKPRGIQGPLSDGPNARTHGALRRSF